MIDFLKIKVTEANTIKYFEKHPLLYFHSERDMLLFDNETIRSRKSKQYKGIILEFSKNSLYITFKPHYYFNNDIHNANDFSVPNCIETLCDFAILFKVDLGHLSIINIEFGINTILPKELIDIKELLSCLIYHQQNEFYTDRKYPLCKFSSSADRTGKTNVYKIIKAYAKGVQFPLHTDLNTFRFEIKSNRKDYIKTLGITTFQDLMDPAVYETLSNVILNEFDEVLIVDCTVAPELSKTRLKNHTERLNPITWRRYINSTQNVYRKNFNKYYRDLDSCGTHLKKNLKKLMADKLNGLKKCADLTVMTKHKKCADLTIYKGQQLTHVNKRECPVTGLDISIQKSSSYMLSHAGLRHLYKTDRNLYEEVKQKHLSRIWANVDLETEIKEIAHNIRDTHRNRIKKQERLYPAYQEQIFNLNTL